MNEQLIISQCQRWVEDIVVALNFCPFAKKELVNQTIRYQVGSDLDTERALTILADELQHLQNHPEVETTLLILADGFSFFDDFIQLVDLAGQWLKMNKLEGIFQIATFHPDYCFADVSEDDASNYTNRAPWPILHILREESMSRAVDAHPDPEGIPERNIALCEQKGRQFFVDYLASLHQKNK
ncbi:DUF1415 domain-containing protein [Thalassotalea mangrovi]|uniref:DUF1415 domain-containing protein n=1 Tax=Thalassotalea mangrovi TaxID=2572245 RepID=A0A4U1B5W3_9GAMM|nr:DUF1415 domain-containing protein [Thalassotalea mangrovi]TKB45843.1 DUF1415 domain-containing protein [Thalassotalea mangrovi]